MADDQTPQKRTFRRKDWATAAEFIKAEHERRRDAPKRSALEKQWKEIDRQVAMEAAPRKSPEGGKAGDWMPAIELPLQASALEVLTADARRLKFPRTSEWYLAHTELSDEYATRFQDRREDNPLIGDKSMGMKLDQETSDALAKGAIDHYHRIYNFRQQIDALDIEAFKYGTYAARVIQVLLPKFASDYRGVKKDRTLGPAVVPVSIKNLFLDDSPQFVMQEGVSIAPAHIRTYFQKLDDLLVAAKTGGVDRGWIESNMKKLEPLGDQGENRGHVELLEWEGDLVIPRSQGRIFLPNIVLTVAVGSGGPWVVRFRESKSPFRSYVVGNYQRDDLTTPYGTSPLLKGRPIQEAATEVANRLIAAGALNAEPPISWDNSDSMLKATGGPIIAPGAQWAADDPSSIKVHAIGNVSDLLQAYIGLLQQYEDLTGVTAPRRGASAKSHTTAFSTDVENVRGLVRTEDFVVSQEQGPLSSILYMEYEIIKKSLTSPTPIYIGTAGMEGFVNLHREDIADNAVFFVQGSAGPGTKREKQQSVVQAFQIAAQLSQISMQMGGPTLNFNEGFKEIFEAADVTNPERFITSAQGVPNAADGVGGVQGTPGGLPPDAAKALAAGQAGGGV